MATDLSTKRATMPEMLPATGCGTMREFYDRSGMLATSDRANIALIRSHVAYWHGEATAARVTIRPSRGHSYRLSGMPWLIGDIIARISDHYDHREGVSGLHY